MNKIKRILFICDDPAKSELLSASFQNEPYQLEINGNNHHVLNSIYNNPPDLILIDLTKDLKTDSRICTELKNDNIYKHLSIIAVLDLNKDEIDWSNFLIDDYVALPLNISDIKTRIKLAFSKEFRELDSNPLSLLPGNNSVINELQKRIDLNERIAFCYVDIDRFKSFNDRYGFSRGDEVLKMAARLLTNIIRDIPGAYLGHVGGDDFIFIIPVEKIESACEDIIRNFDLIVPNFYDPEDRIKGHIVTTNRKGEIEKFELMSLTISVVRNDQERKRYSHFGEMSSIAAVLKKQGKMQNGSKFIVDQRKD